MPVHGWVVGGTLMFDSPTFATMAVPARSVSHVMGHVVPSCDHRYGVNAFDQPGPSSLISFVRSFSQTSCSSAACTNVFSM
jgi:hypothetical protein